MSDRTQRAQIAERLSNLATFCNDFDGESATVCFERWPTDVDRWCERCLFQRASTLLTVEPSHERIQALEMRVMELEMDRVVPGVMVCDACKFQLNTVILDVVNGRTGAPIAPEVEPCPNGCGPLRSLTWREDVKRADESMMKSWEALEESVKLQSHYAAVLNMHDGGQRLVFDSPAAWMNRLDSLKSVEPSQGSGSQTPPADARTEKTTDDSTPTSRQRMTPDQKLLDTLKAISAAHPTLLSEFEQQGIVFSANPESGSWESIALSLVNKISALSLQAQQALSDLKDQ